MSQYQANPWIGHLGVLYHIFAYLKSNTKIGHTGYDLTGMNVDLSVFSDNTYWMEFYGGIEEELPPKMPKPCGRAVSIYSFVGANHAGNVVIRRLHTGIVIFIQNSPIIYFSKIHNTVELATFGSKLVAHMICNDLIVPLKHNLRMFGVRLEYVFCDNSGVVKNMSIPESVIHKKHNTMKYN